MIYDLNKIYQFECKVIKGSTLWHTIIDIFENQTEVHFDKNTINKNINRIIPLLNVPEKTSTASLFKCVTYNTNNAINDDMPSTHNKITG